MVVLVLDLPWIKSVYLVKICLENLLYQNSILCQSTCLESEPTDFSLKNRSNQKMSNNIPTSFEDIWKTSETTPLPCCGVALERSFWEG